ncbi:MAG: sulfide/dihydroorotate dehydrogenase-like FAD/NAD-binding protein [Phycisphaerae bacterium]|nr:sulfide/dihydroorotate dehydrogenase-like FAD/NAD-binding protein [Phycisphaerae bacterium]
MHKILCKQQLSENVFRIEVEAALIARARKPGQFVIVGVVDEYSERIPLTIAGAHPDKGTIELIFQRVGKSTAEMADMNEGDSLGYIAGPLGQPTHIEKVGTVVCVGGGIGNAPLLPIATAMKEAGNKVISIIGARDKSLIILENEFAAISDELIVVTDDGSYGRKGLVTEPLAEICENEKPDLAIVIGPTIMMKFCCKTTEPFGVHTLVSLNTIMVDGTGMCGGCRVEVGGETKFVCVDGPEFDGHKVDFDQMMRRLGAYKVQEQKALEEYKHKCRFGLKNE